MRGLFLFGGMSTRICLGYIEIILGVCYILRNRKRIRFEEVLFLFLFFLVRIFVLKLVRSEVR